MSYASNLMGTWLESYGSFAQDGMTRIREARTALLKAEYKPEKLISDLFYFWVDAPMSLWTAPLRAAPKATPTLFMRVLANDSKADESTEVDAPDEGKVECTDLLRLGDAGKKIPAEAVVVKLDEDRLNLEVRVREVRNHAKVGQEAEQYLGCAYVDNKLLAHIHLIVEPEKK